jgi:hypothetical protein
METTQGSLVIVGANTPECKVFWNGQEVENVGVNVANDVMGSRVVIKVKEDPILAEMQAAGITVRRVV